MNESSTLEHRRECKQKAEALFLADLANADKLSTVIARFAAFREKAEAVNLAVDEVETVAAIETLGIPLGAPLAYQLRMGLAIFRKSFDVKKRDGFAYKKYYDYGTKQGKPKTMKVLRTSIRGKRILIVDEIIDSGGQFLAACHLIDECEGIFVAGLVKAACHPSGDEWSPPHPELQNPSSTVTKKRTFIINELRRLKNRWHYIFGSRHSHGTS
jgi:adenine/guanine phosphoribosyltransferase-like PRPP-binding protein